MSAKPKISIIIPVINPTDCLINQNLPAIKKQTFADFEVILLPCFKNKTTDMLTRKYKWLKIIPTGSVFGPSEKRNLGVKYAAGEILAFIDDDAYPSRHWLKRGDILLSSNKKLAVCGPGILPPKSLFWEKVFDQVLTNRAGSGSFTFRFTPEKGKYVEDFPMMNFFIKKADFIKIGGFRFDYWPGEDSKLCNDFVHGFGGQVFYHPELIVYHHRKNDIKSHLRQHGRYGYQRGFFFAQNDKNSRSIIFLIPSFWVIYLLALNFLFLAHGFYNGFISLLNYNTALLRLTFLPFISYILLAIYIFLKSLYNSKKISIAFGSALMLFLTHFTYGVFFILGYYDAKQNI